MGDYPLEAVQMLAKIAAATEPHRSFSHFEFVLKPQAKDYSPTIVDLMADSIKSIIAHADAPAGVLAPTSSGFMARSLTRFRLPVWIIAVSNSLKTCRDLMFSYGVYSILEESQPKDWDARARRYAEIHGFRGSCFIKAEGPSADRPDINHKMEIIEL